MYIMYCTLIILVVSDQNHKKAELLDFFNMAVPVFHAYSSIWSQVKLPGQL